MYIGSVRFFKHLILTVISLMIIIPTVGWIASAAQNHSLRAQLHTLKFGDFSETAIGDWRIHQFGYLTVHIPNSQITEIVEVVDGVEITSFESTTAYVSVSVERFVDFVPFLQYMGVADDIIMTSVLQGSLLSGVTTFIEESGGQVLESSEGQTHEVRYFRSHGTTDLTHTYFEMRVFAYAGDFYFVLLLWDTPNATVVEPFFQSIRFNV
jgi:hypothetical protein